MRLLNTTENGQGLFDMAEFSGDSIPEYAILSHTWGGQEISYQDLRHGNSAMINTEGYCKIRWCCFVARSANISWAWVDTCCIDKRSSAELTEAINSMYRWYQQARVCYALLSDVPRKLFEDSRWFTRGWTLQELVAPREVIFFNGDGQQIGTRASLQEKITRCTGISERILAGAAALDSICVAQRMSWAARRQTSRVEDRAYSLLGIFDIHMPLIYGEGERAFFRLQEEIIRALEDYSIFAWKADLQPGAYGGLLAPSPDAFADSATVTLAEHLTFRNMPTWTLSNRGIQLKLPFMGIGPQRLGMALLNCSTRVSVNNWLMGIYLRDVSDNLTLFERVWCDAWETVSGHQLLRFSNRLICVPQRRLAVVESEFTETMVGVFGSEFCTQRREMDFFQKVAPGAGSGSHEAKSAEEDLCAALAYATHEDDLQSIRLLEFEKAPTVDTRTRARRLKFWAAAAGGHTSVVWFLINIPVDRIDINAESVGSTPLCTAAKRGHTDIVWLLLSQKDIQTHFGDSIPPPLQVAIQQSKLDVLKMLIAREYFARCLVSHRDELLDMVMQFTESTLSFQRNLSLIDYITGLLMW